MEETIKAIGKQIKNGMSFPLGVDENNNFVFLVKDTKQNLNKFLNKIEKIETMSEQIIFINSKTNNKTRANIVIIKMDTGNYYPLFIIEGIENMLSKYNAAKKIELVFFDGLNINNKTAILEKKELPPIIENKLDKENHLDIFNFIKDVKPYELEGLVAQIQKKEAKPEIYYS